MKSLVTKNYEYIPVICVCSQMGKLLNIFEAKFVIPTNEIMFLCVLCTKCMGGLVMSIQLSACLNSKNYWKDKN